MPESEVKTEFVRICKECGYPVYYNNKRSMDWYERNNSLCRDCRCYYSSEIHHMIHAKYKIKCYRCDDILFYNSEHYYELAKQNNKLCKTCQFSKWVDSARTKIPINHKACDFMDGLNKKGYNFIHNRNGGEYYVPICAGYFLDGFDNERGIILEWDEEFHKNQKKEDRERELLIFEYFRGIGKTIRIVRYSEVENKFYEVFDDYKK